MSKQPYHITEVGGKRVSMSKSSLGHFMYHALKCGADVYQMWAFAPQYDRSAVYPAINATPEQVDYLKEQGYMFRPPPTVKVK